MARHDARGGIEAAAGARADNVLMVLRGRSRRSRRRLRLTAAGCQERDGQRGVQTPRHPEHALYRVYQPA